MSEIAPRELRALKRLCARGMMALPTADDAGGYGVYPQGDRRRRPVARLSGECVMRLISDGALTSCASGDETNAVVLSEEGRAMLRRRSARSPDPFRIQHMQLTEDAPSEPEADAGGEVVRDAHESPLAWLYRRTGATGERLLTNREFQAGERLRADYHRGRYIGRVTSDWEAAPQSKNARGPLDARLAPGESAVAARARVDAALRHVGSGLEPLLSAVCLDGRGLNDVERAFGWPSRSGKVVLKIALARLADHYGLPTDAPS